MVLIRFISLSFGTIYFLWKRTEFHPCCLFNSIFYIICIEKVFSYVSKNFTFYCLEFSVFCRFDSMMFFFVFGYCCCDVLDSSVFVSFCFIIQEFGFRFCFGDSFRRILWCPSWSLEKTVSFFRTRLHHGLLIGGSGSILKLIGMNFFLIDVFWYSQWDSYFEFFCGV